MKSKNFSERLVLRKEKISSLINEGLNQIKSGDGVIDPKTMLDSHCVGCINIDDMYTIGWGDCDTVFC